MVQALIENGGELVEPNAKADYIVVPLDQEKPDLHDDILTKESRIIKYFLDFRKLNCSSFTKISCFLERILIEHTEYNL